MKIQIDDLVRDATTEEIADHAKRTADHEARIAIAEQKTKEKAAAQAKLAALGLTVEDLTALGL